MIHLVRKWNGFLFQPQTPHALSCFRIAAGLLSIYALLMLIPLVEQFFTSEGVLPSSTLINDPGRRYYSILFWTDGYVGVLFVLLLGILAALLFTFGRGLPWTSILLYIVFASFHDRNPLVFSGAEHLLRNLLFFFMLAPRQQSFVLRNRSLVVGTEDDNKHLAPPWAQRMMQIQVTLVYLCTGIAKLRNELWRDGTAMYYVFGLVDFNVVGVEQLMNYPLLYNSFTYGSLAAEFAIPVMLWCRSMRPFAIGLGVALHLWMMCFMTIPLFSPLMISSYLLFLSEDECRWLSRYFRRPGCKSRDAAHQVCK